MDPECVCYFKIQNICLEAVSMYVRARCVDVCARPYDAIYPQDAVNGVCLAQLCTTIRYTVGNHIELDDLEIAK